MNYNPQKLKFKKIHNKKLLKKEYPINKIKTNHKFYSIQIIESGYISDYNIESLRRVISRGTKRKCKIFIRNINIFPLTKKALGMRMGKGKGPIKYWIKKIRAGSIIIDVLNFNFNNNNFILKKFYKFKQSSYFNLLFILKKSLKKLPLKSRILVN